MKRLSRTAMLVLALVAALASAAEETPAERDARMAWWREARFGMFIHWGPSAMLGRDSWVMHNDKIPLPEYEKLVLQFDPVKFDAAEWVQLAKDAGQKYIIITSKHHDGFCLFDSALTDYDMMSTPFKRDVLKELADECARQGIKLGFYYSILDWHHPDYVPRPAWDERPSEGADYDRYIDYMKDQLRELLTGYGDVVVVWFDGGWDHRAEANRAREVVAMVREFQPRIIINNRINLPEDYDTPEQSVPGVGLRGRDWETCMTINRSWGYSATDANHKSADGLVRVLVDVASKGGNFLLNVGPRPDGTIQPEHHERLLAMGRWLEENGESIYGTTAGPFRQLPWGRCTARPGRLYLHVFDWPAGGRLVLPGLRNEVTRAYVPARGEELDKPVERVGEDVVVLVGGGPRDTIDTVVVLEIEGEPEVLPYAVPQGDDWSVTLQAQDAQVHGTQARFQVTEGVGNIGYWTDGTDWLEWSLAVERPGRFKVEVTFACAEGTGGAEYAVATGDSSVTGTVRETGSWSTFVTETIGELEIAGAGRRTVTVKPLTKPGYAVMNLATVRLIPVHAADRE